jgi:beta-N-acetylglucosaminidase
MDFIDEIKSLFGFDNPELINLDNNQDGIRMLDKLSRLQDERRIKPLDQFDSVAYAHRRTYVNNTYNLLIGDSYFMIPPEFIAVTSEASPQSIVTLRQENTQKLKSGYHKRTIMIDLIFNGSEQLNGYKVKGPEVNGDNGYYYMDGLRQLLAQFKCTPFLPITNELINGMYGIYTVALQAITIRTIPGFPDVMSANITLQEVNVFPYIQMPDAVFKYTIDWDLFRFFYQRMLTEKHEYKKLQSLPANKEHNKFKLSILDSSVFETEEATKYNLLQIICDKEIVKLNESGEKDTTNYTLWVDSDSHEVSISSFQCTYANILTNIQLADAGSPTVQFMGGMDTKYDIIFETLDYSVVQALEQCQIENDALVRGNRKFNSLGFIKLESELVEFTGSLFVTIDSVTTTTVPDFPGLYSVHITCLAYDIAQTEREDLNGFLPFECKEPGKCGEFVEGVGFVSDHVHKDQAIYQDSSGLLTKIKQDAYAEWKLRNGIELYPDLHLPTYDEVDEVITKIRKFRTDNNLNQLEYSKYPRTPTYMLHGLKLNNKVTFDYENEDKTIIDVNTINDANNEYNGYVDPDFYVFYPASYESFFTEDEECYNNYTPKQRNSITVNKISNPLSMGQNVDIIEKMCNRGEYLASNNRCEYENAGIGELSSNGKPQFDCIGFITYLLKYVGLLPANQPWTSMTDTFKNKELFTNVSLSEVKRGDIILEGNTSTASFSHAMLYLGDNRIAHASGEKKGVICGNHYVTNGACLRLNIASVPGYGTGSSSYDSVDQIIHQDLGVWSPITAEEMNAWIDKWKPNGCRFTGQGAAFVEAGYATGLDPRYIMAHAAHESGWGSSAISKDKNNFFGINAVDWDPYAQASSFEGSFANGILEGAKWIARNYYNNPNYNQKTLYSMRYNNNQHQYATDPEWHTKIANIMVNAPNNASSAGNVLMRVDFDSICRVIMAETQGEEEAAEKAMAQVIYDMLTFENKNKFGTLSNILNSGVFPAPYQGELNTTIENNVKAVFCNNDKWSKYQTLYFLKNGDDSRGTPEAYSKNHDVIGDAGAHTFWGNKKGKRSDIKYTIIESDGAAYRPQGGTATTTTITHDVVTPDIEKFGQPVYIKTDAIMYDNTVLIWGSGQDKISRDQLNSTEHVFNTAFCDEVQYSGRGKLVRAFPTYMLCLLDDQAQWYNGNKLWTNYYIHRSVVDISAHATNDMPTETATITITNAQHNLDRVQGGLGSYKLSEDDGYNAFQQWWYSWSHTMPGFGPKLTKKLIELHQVICDQMLLREGARVHLRMGYGSDPLGLAPIINGHISEVALGDQITMVITSDGHELIQHIVSVKESLNQGWGGLFGLGEEQESSNIIADIMCKRSNWITHLAGSTFEASKYSIEHFGLYFNKTLFKASLIDVFESQFISDFAEEVQSTQQSILMEEADSLGEQMIAAINTAYLSPSDPFAMLGQYIGILINVAIDYAKEYFESSDEDDLEGSLWDIIKDAADSADLSPSNSFEVNMTEMINSIAFAVMEYFESKFKRKESETENAENTEEELGESNAFLDMLSDTWDGHQENYDILKNIYKANYKRQHYIYTTIELGQGNEKNVIFNSYNMTPWDIFQVCTQQVPEYILKPAYHQFDSRLYFGLPLWMEKYRYDYLNGVVYEECKSAAQVHFIDSMDCIIDNQVRVTSKFSNTNIKVMYTRGEEQVSTQTIHSDDSIDASKQKTVILDTPITQDALGVDAIYEIFGYDIGEESARRVGISNLLYGWQQQYQGQLILMGHPGLKPHDYMMINDSFANLYGISIVREVIHSFNTNTGYTTSVVPGMLAFSTDENSGMIYSVQNYLMLLNCFSSYTQVRKNLRNNYEKNLSLIADLELMRSQLAIAANLNIIDDFVSGSVSTIVGIADIYTAAKAGYDIFKVVKGLYDINKAKGILPILITFAKGYKAAKATYEVVQGARMVMKVTKGIKGTLAAIKAGTIAVGGMAGGWPSLVVAAIWMVVDILLDEVFEWLSNKNVCTLLPMWWEGYPFVAGVKDGEKILLMNNNSTATKENTQDDGIKRDVSGEFE